MNTDARKPVASPIGQFSQIHFTEVNPDPDFGGKHEGQLLIDKDAWRKDGKKLAIAILKCAQEHIKLKGGKKPTKLSEFKNPLQDGDSVNEDRQEEGKNILGSFENRMILTAKNSNQPDFVDAGLEPMNGKAIANIKAGDWGKYVVTPYYYNKGGNKGIGLWLEMVQYWKAGVALDGPSTQDKLSVLEALEVEDLEEDEPSLDEAFEEATDEEEEEEAPKKKAKSKTRAKSSAKAKKGKAAKKAEPEEEEDESDDEDIDIDDI